MLFYVLSYIDRVNLGFAALTMNADLALSATVFGVATAAFYVTYILFEVPSNLMLVRFGAKVWIPRIMITWGLASMATMFAAGPHSLYALRALLGVAEAGLFPGILYYLSSWFPDSQRARVNSTFLTALPLALVIGAPFSGLLLEMDGLLGLKGWQWLFLLQGAPTVLVGIAAYFVLPDSPAVVSWLTDQEKEALQRQIEDENQAKRSQKSTRVEKPSLWSMIANARVIGFGFASFCLMATLTVLGTWTPLIVRELMGNTDRVLFVSLAAAIPPIAAVPVMLLVGRRSDRSSGHVRYTAVAMACSSAGWLICALAVSPAARIMGLVVTATGAFTAMTTFWATVARSLAREQHAVGLALVASISTMTSVVSPIVIGFLRDTTGNFAAGMWYAAGLLIIGVGLFLASARPRSDALS